MNSKNDKLAFLKAIASGEIRPENVPENPIIVADRKEMFLGLIMAGSSAQADKDATCPICFVGEARKALNELIESIKE